MCACRPGATCSYHLYANWPQARKDAWNARRRATYARRKNGSSSAGILGVGGASGKAHQSADSSGASALIGSGVDSAGSSSYSRGPVELNEITGAEREFLEELEAADWMTEDVLVKARAEAWLRQSSSGEAKAVDRSFSEGELELWREWTGNAGSSMVGKEKLAAGLLALIGEHEDPRGAERTLYRHIGFHGEEALEDFLNSLSAHGPVALGGSKANPVSTTRDESWALRGNGSGVVFRLTTARGVEHPNFGYESEVLLAPDEYELVGRRQLVESSLGQGAVWLVDLRERAGGTSGEGE